MKKLIYIILCLITINIVLGATLKDSGIRIQPSFEQNRLDRLNEMQYVTYNGDVCNETWRPCITDENGTTIECTSTTLNNMFESTSDFDATYGDITGWNTSCITEMAATFSGSDFNQDISGWNTSSVTTMEQMFSGTPFNQNINSWDTSKVIDMSGMFKDTTQFNQDISSWNTINVLSMYYMFGSSVFNQPINSWDTSNVVDMAFMFYYTTFNQPLNSWNTSNVVDMSLMFYNTPFNHPINSWDTSSVTDMALMFGGSMFNQPINSWDTSSVTDMSFMFSFCDDDYNIITPFNQDISSWNVSSVTTMNKMFCNSGLSTSNYDKILTGWGSQTVQENVELDATPTKYSIYGINGRNALESNGWTITDGGLDDSIIQEIDTNTKYRDTGDIINVIILLFTFTILVTILFGFVDIDNKYFRYIVMIISVVIFIMLLYYIFNIIF
jgi:surface protein